MVTRDGWLSTGLLVVAGAGLSGLRVDSLAAAASVTKGSFYHHFVDLADFRRSLLAHYEEQCTAQHIEANSRLGLLPPRDRLWALADAVLAGGNKGLDVQMRSWAHQDDDAHDTLARVDARRIAYLRDLAVELVGDTSRGDDLAHTIYYLHIGSEHTVTPGSAQQLRRLWRRALDAAQVDRVSR